MPDAWDLRKMINGVPVLHALLAAHRRAAAEGGELRLIIIPAVGAAARVIYLTGVDHVIPCCPGLAGTAGSGRWLVTSEPWF